VVTFTPGRYVPFTHRIRGSVASKTGMDVVANRKCLPTGIEPLAWPVIFLLYWLSYVRRVIRELILRKVQSVLSGIDWLGGGGPQAGCCDCCDEPWNFIKGEGCLDWLKDCHLFEQDSTTWS
jgi:hypothetical protein